MKVNLDIINGKIKKNPFASFLHFQAVQATGDSVTLVFHNRGTTWNNPNQTMYGGILYAMADSAMSLACEAAGKPVVTLDLAMNYLAPAWADTCIRAVATLIHQGRTTMVGLCDFYDDRDRYLAHGRGTFFVTDKNEV
ncbi:PaaI family thioesterase [Megasphaera lornae]|jgi:hypothetical protein|uniref:Thioesterase domain-containing protein n=1 Tax=Megasphaera lornae TaxID=1000568 RepID=D3LWQ7_9FIRM|nr:PaaI family thioesterase [Megasphaera genomosp. type_1]EFD93294.1 hypothetical protein HMPREF0889_0714 [Megasphaera genomosp. type_1 str. 28L]KXB89945.1 hypothetical protein HMPREF3033_01624 [Veillonellaceae bacterium DNF00751]MUP49820.1 PaaI family thioesterase [Veillonellaceae bacterium M1-70]